MIRDRIFLYNHYSILQKRCIYCNEFDHASESCYLINPVKNNKFINEKILKLNHKRIMVTRNPKKRKKFFVF